MVFDETKRNETKQSLTLEKSDGWAALFFCNPITVLIELFFCFAKYQRQSNLTKISNSFHKICTVR